MQDYSNIFSIKNSTFLFAGSARGLFYDEIELADHKKIVNARIAGFKGKDLTCLLGFMPNIKELTIEKNAKLQSLEGAHLVMLFGNFVDVG